MRYDLEVCKQLGFNILRKHIKVEPARYYYHCDRMGLIVWQDMPNGGRPVGSLLSFLTIMFNLKRRDDRAHGRAGRGEPASQANYRRELRAMVDALHSFACIGMWVPFNEAWGQFDAHKVAAWLQEHDPTRPVDHASGWFDQGGGDFRSLHVYFKKLKPFRPEAHRGLLLSEFGGYSLKLDGHVWDPKTEFGYKKLESSEELTEAYLALLEEQLKPWLRQGLSGAVYTQTTDVEIEINGFLTYDRAVLKMDAERLAQAHRGLLQHA
jgi:beta-galactosidase/beta-glucuronidase